jgi:hypothetical protein
MNVKGVFFTFLAKAIAESLEIREKHPGSVNKIFVICILKFRLITHCKHSPMQKITGALFCLIVFYSTNAQPINNTNGRGALQTAVPAKYNNDLTACHGEKRDLVVAGTMPYVTVKVGNSTGLFLLDFGTTASTIDTNGFLNRHVPRLVPGTTNQFADFDFYGSWGTVSLNIQDHSTIQNIGPVRQAGILGTDFLSLNAFTVDYELGGLYRRDTALCNDSMLRSQGFHPVSTAGYYSNDLSKLKPGTANIPTVPVRIGSVQAVAQVDPGFDDRLFPHSVNINKAFFKALASAGIILQPYVKGNINLTTCAGITETLLAYKLPKNSSFEIVGNDGRSVSAVSDAIIFVKDPPQEAKKCGGIGTWETPAAQIGASFLKESKNVIFDPFRSLVWFKIPLQSTSKQKK